MKKLQEALKKMQLTDYRIKIVEGKKIIDFDNPSLENLSLLLNWNYLTVEKIDRALNTYQYINNNWNDIDSMVCSLYGGYWDTETLAENNVTGDWFTPDEWDDLAVSINKSNQHVYIDNVLTTAPIVELSLIDFIDILDQWKQIQLP